MGLGVQPAGWKCAHRNALPLSELAAQEGPSLLNQKVFSKIMYRKLKMCMIWRHLGRGGLC